MTICQFLDNIVILRVWILVRSTKESGRLCSCADKECALQIALTMYAVLAIFLVGKDPTQVYFGEQTHEVREHHPESTVVAVSPPWGSGVGRHPSVYLARS